jgi:plastocyanin
MRAPSHWLRSMSAGTVGLLAVLALASCSAAQPTAPVATSTVDLPPSYKFVPADITVPAGTEVTWTNNDNFTHSVRLLDDGGDVMNMKPGESVSFTFETPGLRHYDCSFHSQNMKGTVLVTEAGSSGASS